MVTASSLRPAQNGVNPTAKALFDWIERQHQTRRTGYDLARQYYGGDHRVLLSDRLKAFLPQALHQSFRSNYCDVVADSVAERLSVTGFLSSSEPLAEWAWEQWQRNRMDATQGLVHTDALILGDSYVLVDWNAETLAPRFTYQMAEMVIPHYNEDTRKIDWASKKWLWQREIGEAPVARLNLYFPDHLEKYIASNNVWLPFQEEGDTEWPLPWTDARGQPLGVPLVHFRNKALGQDFGESEINDVIPLQDLLNKTLVDLVQILDTQAFGQRWTMNVAHGASVLDVVPGSVWDLHSEEENAAVGEFLAAQVDGPIRTIEMLVQHIASTSRTPQYLFQIGGGMPSGEALKTSETGLVHKVKNRQIAFGNAWEDAMLLAMRIQAAFGAPVSGAEDAIIEAQWADPETRNEEMVIQGLAVKRSQLGVPRKQIWREAGYTVEEIDQMEADLEEEKRQDSNIGAELLKAFSAGEPGIGERAVEPRFVRPRKVVKHVERDAGGRISRVTEEEAE